MQTPRGFQTQTPQQRLRRPQSMQTLSSVRSSARLGTPRTPGAGVEAYRGRIHVGVRVKPMPHGPPPAWLVNPAAHTIDHESAGNFRFDRVYDGVAENDEVFAESVEPLVNQVVEGYNATVFAYGTTGSGKTYTMQGTPHDRGVIPRSVYRLFDLLQARGTPASVNVSYLEIYNERVLDLLSEQPVEVKLFDSTTQGTIETKVKGQRAVTVQSAEELLHHVAMGDRLRRTHSTQYNEHSSRSHAVVRVELVNDGHASILYLCDLAGSERALQDAERRKEGSFINKSLLTLGTIISLLSQGGLGHLPYRESKLTRLLQPSLSGSALVAVLCTVQLNATASNAETVNSLRFAARAKNIAVTVKRNTVFEDPSVALNNVQRALEQRHIECESLRRELTKVRAERDDFQDKLAILEISENADADRSLEEMTGISFGSGTEELRSQLALSTQEVETLRQQNQHLLAQYEELHSAITQLESDSARSSPAPDQVVELQEQLKDRDLAIAALTGINAHRNRFDALCSDALGIVHSLDGPRGSTGSNGSNGSSIVTASNSSSDVAIQDLRI